MQSNKNEEAKQYLITILQTIHQHSTITPQLRAALRTVLAHTQADPLVLWKNEQSHLLAHAMLLILVHDISDEEDDLLFAAHLAYFYYTHSMSIIPGDEHLVEMNKKLVILVSNFSDYLRHTVAMSYRGKAQNPTEEEFIKSLSIANKRVHFLEIRALDAIEKKFKDYNDDPFLIQRENELALEVEFTHENLLEGELLHKVLVGYIAKKIQLGDLAF